MSENIRDKYPLVKQRLRTLLDEKDMSASELAKKSGVGKASISHYMNGTHCPNSFTASKLAYVFDVKPEFIMGFEDTHNEISDSTKEILLQLAHRRSQHERMVQIINRMDEKTITEWLSYGEFLVNKNQDK